MNKVYEFDWICGVDNGLHAFESAMLITDLQKVVGNVLIMDKKGTRIDAKSVLGLMSMSVQKEQKLKVFFEGSEKAFADILIIFEKRGLIEDIKERL